MRLSSIRIEGIRNIGHLELRLEPGSPLVITGAAASGKTSVLEAIVVAKRAFHPGALEPKTDGGLSSGRRSAEVELEWALDDSDRERARVSGSSFITRWGLGVASSPASVRLRELVEACPLTYYDQDRTLGGQKTSKGVPRPLDGLAATTKYDWIEQCLVTLAEEQARRTVATIEATGIALASRELGALRGFDALLATFCPGLRWSGTERVDDRIRPLLVRSNGDRSSIDALASSERMGVLFAATMDALRPRGGIILIDTPELFQHPANHAQFFGTIAAAAPGAQVIAASTSAGILRAHPRQSVVVLDERSGRAAT